MRFHRRRRPVEVPSSGFAGFRFPAEVILLAVRWYLRFGLSYRDLEELLAERGVEVDHVTLYRWVQRFTPQLVDAARPSRHSGGDRWFVDETYLKVSGVWKYLYRAVDQFGQVIDVMLRRPSTAWPTRSTSSPWQSESRARRNAETVLLSSASANATDPPFSFAGDRRGRRRCRVGGAGYR
jgi:hypothetical protein